MNTAAILFIFITTHSFLGGQYDTRTVKTVEFNSMAACVDAKETINFMKKLYNDYKVDDINTFCEKK